jgi:uncharacterized protein
MKRNTSLFTASFFQYGLILLICLLTSCTNNDATAQQKKPVTTNDKVDPKVDIHTAVATGNIDAVKQHIAAGTDIDQKDALGGSSPLITACLYAQNAIAKLLIEAGANINFQNNDGSTALHVAAFFCKPEMVKLLLEKKADKTVKNKYKSTACESVAGSYNTVKQIYEQMKQMLEPMGVQLDLAYIEKTRPSIAAMLK